VDYEIIDLTTQIVSAHVASNDVTADELPRLIRDVHQALAAVGQTSAEPIKNEHVADAKGLSLPTILSVSIAVKISRCSSATLRPITR
jgi:predicted transcriptional regulator